MADSQAYLLSSKTLRLTCKAVAKLREDKPKLLWQDALHILDTRVDKLSGQIGECFAELNDSSTAQLRDCCKELCSIGRPDVIRSSALILRTISPEFESLTTELLKLSSRHGDAKATALLYEQAEANGDGQGANRYMTLAAVQGHTDFLFDISHKAMGEGLGLNPKAQKKPQPVFAAFLLGSVLLSPATSGNFSENDIKRAGNILYEGSLTELAVNSCTICKAIDAAYREKAAEKRHGVTDTLPTLESLASLG